MFDPPIFINVRDRVTPLRKLVAWLESAGHQRIVLLDNASTYEPLIEYLKGTPHDVVCLGHNLGSRALWVADLAPASDWYVYTDPDIVPTADCPLDLVKHLRDLLARQRTFLKAGPGLYLEDVPASVAHAIAAGERGPLIRGQVIEPGAYVSMIDTTLALYRPGTRMQFQALRTGPPYEARHLGWYSEADPTEEDLYYLARAEAGPLHSSWATRACA